MYTVNQVLTNFSTSEDLQLVLRMGELNTFSPHLRYPTENHQSHSDSPDAWSTYLGSGTTETLPGSWTHPNSRFGAAQISTQLLTPWTDTKSINSCITESLFSVSWTSQRLIRLRAVTMESSSRIDGVEPDLSSGVFALSSSQTQQTLLGLSSSSESESSLTLLAGEHFSGDSSSIFLFLSEAGVGLIPFLLAVCFLTFLFCTGRGTSPVLHRFWSCRSSALTCSSQDFWLS